MVTTDSLSFAVLKLARLPHTPTSFNSKSRKIRAAELVKCENSLMSDRPSMFQFCGKIRCLKAGVRRLSSVGKFSFCKQKCSSRMKSQSSKLSTLWILHKRSRKTVINLSYTENFQIVLFINNTTFYIPVIYSLVYSNC